MRGGGREGGRGGRSDSWNCVHTTCPWGFLVPFSNTCIRTTELSVQTRPPPTQPRRTPCNMVANRAATLQQKLHLHCGSNNAYCTVIAKRPVEHQHQKRSAKEPAALWQQTRFTDLTVASTGLLLYTSKTACCTMAAQRTATLWHRKGFLLQSDEHDSCATAVCFGVSTHKSHPHVFASPAHFSSLHFAFAIHFSQLCVSVSPRAFQTVFSVSIFTPHVSVSPYIFVLPAPPLPLDKAIRTDALFHGQHILPRDCASICPRSRRIISPPPPL